MVPGLVRITPFVIACVSLSCKSWLTSVLGTVCPAVSFYLGGWYLAGRASLIRVALRWDFCLWSILGDWPGCWGRMLVNMPVSAWAPALWSLPFSVGCHLDEQSPSCRGLKCWMILSVMCSSEITANRQNPASALVVQEWISDSISWQSQLGYRKSRVSVQFSCLFSRNLSELIRSPSCAGLNVFSFAVLVRGNGLVSLGCSGVKLQSWASKFCKAPSSVSYSLSAAGASAFKYIIQSSECIFNYNSIQIMVWVFMVRAETPLILFWRLTVALLKITAFVCLYNAIYKASLTPFWPVKPGVCSFGEGI